MDRALTDMGMDEELQRELNQAFYKTADFMRNRPEKEQSNPFTVLPSVKK
jgi:truncated hemoglobin YjbI